ncbi:hypothetical protein ACIBI9_39050 [Nonomuraea sp. NPDC050451]|uniref:hypothetical protein n=1 Tax=Nonomuraea sp. NPDC050451 TaxID=3364364 RepID=UPI00379942F2
MAVVHEANLTGGFGAEVIARVVERGVPLSAPPLRIATDDLRIPAAPGLQQAAIPGRDAVVRQLLSVCAPGVAA